MEQVTTETMKKQIEEIKQKKSMTVEYRKMKKTVDDAKDTIGFVEKNMDITLMVSSNIVYLFTGIGITLSILWGLYAFGVSDSSIPGGWKTFLGSIISVAIGIISGKKINIAQLHTEHGEIVNGLIAKAKKTRKELDENLNTIVVQDDPEFDTKLETKTCLAPPIVK